MVFKPSEYTPAVGQWIVDTFAEVVPEHREAMETLRWVAHYVPTGLKTGSSGNTNFELVTG